jgi:erythromycin esterase
VTPTPAAVQTAPPAKPVAPTPPPAVEPWPGLNLGFEQVAGDQPTGWRNNSTYEATAADDVKHGGDRSLRLHSAGTSRFGAATASVPAATVRGKHLKLHGWIKTDGVKGEAAMFLRVDGGGGAFDNMGARAISGTRDWIEATVEVDVPDLGDTVVFGPLLSGEGTAWFDDLRFEVTDRPKPHPIALEGTVVDAGGAPVAGADVALVTTAGVQKHVRSDAAGKFHFDAVSGKWGFSASHAGAVGAFIDRAQLDDDARAIRLTLGASDGVVVHGKLGPARPAPDSYVAVSMLSGHDADVFAVPVAADGTFEATLPRGDDYSAQILEGGQGRGSGRRTGDRVEIAIPLLVLAPPPQEVVDWIAAHAIALSTPKAEHGLDDIAPIGKLIGKARVVGLGEATHGTREFFQLKHRVLEYLVAKQGFTVFAIEANQPECRAINDYVLHGTGDPKAGLDGIYFWTWNTEEVLAMIEWMRAWNTDPAHRKKVQFLGFDMQTSKVAYATVAAYLTRVAPDAAPGLLAPIEVLGNQLARPEVIRLSDDDRKRLIDGLAAIAKLFDTRRKPGSKQTSPAEFDDARHDVTILEQATALYLADAARATGGPNGFNVRDRSMAANIGWILDHQPAGTRIVVWAHNGHVANHLFDSGSGLENMGSHLRRQFKTGYINLGFVFSEGSFQAIEMKGDPRGELNEITLGPPPESHASTAFTRTGKPLLVLDLRALPRQGPVHDWFIAPHLVRDTGAVFSIESNMTSPAVLPDLFDAVIFVDKTTRARPLHPR